MWRLNCEVWTVNCEFWSVKSELWSELWNVTSPPVFRTLLFDMNKATMHGALQTTTHLCRAYNEDINETYLLQCA